MPLSSQQRYSAAPPVRVEVRHGGAPPVGFDVLNDEFVIGSVPGCDLRIPGNNLPPQVCIIQRTSEGAQLRKVAPALPILLNGSPIAPNGVADLTHGDVISVGAVDLHVAIAFQIAQQAPPAPSKDFRHEEWERKHRELDARAQAIEEQARELDADRVLWYERRQEIEKELQTARDHQNVERPEVVAKLRARIEAEVADEYRSRREEVERMQLAVREAAVQLREKKQQFEDTLKNADPRLRELDAREKDLEARFRTVELQSAELKRLRESGDSGRNVQEVRLQQREQDLARREVELAAREMAARDLANAADRDRIQYQSDLVRVDRLAAALDAKERSLELRAVEIDQRYEQFKHDGRDFEETLRIFDEREENVKDEEARQAARREELDAREARLNGRLAEIETQQTTLVALRGRLEYLRQDLLSQESRVSDDQVRTEEEIRQANERLRQAEAVREQVDAEKSGHEEGFRLYQERSALMAQAVERMRAMQEQITAESDRLKSLEAELGTRAVEQAEHAGLIQAKAAQLLEAQERIEADRVAIREREAAFRQSEEARDALQEQLRLRSEELAARQRDVEERGRLLHEQAQDLATQLRALEDLRSDANSARRLTDEEAAILAERDEKMRLAEATIAEQKHQLEESQARFEQEQADAEERLTKAKSDVEELKEALSDRTKELLGQMPDLEQRAQAALDRTAQAREAMRSQLAELHAYALKSQEDLQVVRSQVQDELSQLRDHEQSLNRAKSEHRLAVSSFRQQLIEWQGRFAGLKQTLHHGETRLVRREKEVEQAAHQVAERAEKIQQQEQEVTEKRTEVDRHLGDMQSWFRKKFREIAESRWSKHTGQDSEAGILQLPPREPSTQYSVLSTQYSENAILPLPDDLDPADRKLGELLRSLDVVDRETLHAMWDEARRQRRTLRQVLLSGGYLTLYQLALIESGNLSGLMLGRFRVIDRLLSTPREAIYRVFDPQSRSQDPGDAGTCLLRHLGEAEMLDAVRPDEYRQRFGAARDLAHPNVAATFEVLDVNGRPAVVQEWLHGLPGSDWPTAVSAPGVWHRLMMQAALGLHAAHTVGLMHGRLSPNSFLLTRSGVVKLIGVGEPPWLHAGGAVREANPEDDLRSLGQVALSWMQGGRRKGVKLKPFPPGLIYVLRSLGVSPDEGGVPLAVYPSTAALLEDLDRAASEVPSDHGAWDKLLSYVGENGGDGIVLRQSA
jgi:chromosome segregation ATPase